MKKITFILSVLGVTMLSCQKEELAGPVDNGSAGAIVKTLDVTEAEWTADDLKSSFVSGTGISLSGTENISVFYSKYDSSAEKQVALGIKPVVATPQSNGKYGFSHNEVSGAESYNYFYLMPHHHTTESSGGTRLFAVQFPGENTYDQYYDYLIGQPEINVPKTAAEVSINSFKRISAPVNFVVNDPEGLLEGEAARIVTVDFESSAVPVAGGFVPEFSTVYSEAGINRIVGGTKNTAITALYPDGLEPVAGAYNVWYSALPATLSAGQIVTVTVTSETKTVTCQRPFHLNSR